MRFIVTCNVLELFIDFPKRIPQSGTAAFRQVEHNTSPRNKWTKVNISVYNHGKNTSYEVMNFTFTREGPKSRTKYKLD